MKISIVQDKKVYRIAVRRDLSHLLTKESIEWLTEKNEDDFDYSDEWREIEEEKDY